MMNHYPTLQGKVAVVTGAAQGIGKSICEVFGSHGAAVVVSSRRDTGEPVAAAVRERGGDAIFVRCDVAVEPEVQALMDAAVTRYGRIDILVNNAGVNFVRPFIEVTPADWDRVINTDLRGTYLCSWYCVPHMISAGGGSIINITSVHTLACLPGAAPYDAAKWGVVGLTKSMAVELAPQRVRVNALSPGLIDTKIWQDIQAAATDPAAVHDYWRSNIPMGRVGSPEEIAQTAVFLAGDAASYITGANILADGGMTSQLISREPYRSEAIKGD